MTKFVQCGKMAMTDVITAPAPRRRSAHSQRTEASQVAVPKVAAEDTTIVVKGIFSPALFSPSWLLMQQLIGPGEFDAAEVQVIASELASFRAGWLNLQVTADGIQASTTDPGESERLRDLVVGILSTLTVTPVAALGINTNIHFVASDFEHWHAFGDSLTPKEFWNGFLELSGMRSITMIGARQDSHAGQIQVTVETSNLIENGVFFAHNDHFSLNRSSDTPKSRAQLQKIVQQPLEPSLSKRDLAIDILGSEWGQAMTRARNVLSKISKKMGEV
ncbi:hypothetical protein ACWEOE_01315 [Amycolatopsis sp. NPDC004368]